MPRNVFADDVAGVRYSYTGRHADDSILRRRETLTVTVTCVMFTVTPATIECKSTSGRDSDSELNFTALCVSPSAPESRPALPRLRRP
jgi:hypothetical protein